MNDTDTSPNSAVEHRVLRDLENAGRQITHECCRCVSEYPLASLLAGFAAGYLISHRTVRRMLSLQVKLLGALAGPAVTLYGAAKLLELAKENCGREPPSVSST